MCLPLVVGVLYLSSFCCALLCVLSSFAITLKRKREQVALFLSSYGCLVCNCYLTLPHSAVGWYTVCDCGIA